jgi:hypothetical protein
MSKQNQKQGLSNRNPYDLSQPGLALRPKRNDKVQAPRVIARESSYNMTQSSSIDVIKRIKMR